MVIRTVLHIVCLGHKSSPADSFVMCMMCAYRDNERCYSADEEGWRMEGVDCGQAEYAHVVSMLQDV